ncbi:acyl-CoA thioesterase/bile acid-CoA:amino acid N-acyltransferase family protein [Virgisporangium aurantiacum]|uniref:Palmitoyl-CoA hydrolase n=1 Tax=Virgisporangium aurantiacum TaxID=175570 RepID=A0A8J4E5N4_9ACTN|nr:acyl-CoA thioesterase/bile acid-CoA:amino acid N-acyltransferase family protein [Virgisporangium aurantiacum]GIJ62501.1 palmitoyl-CoA hydrolase [Virgisporangium aurantiacum]
MRFEISPTDPNLDTALRIRVVGLPPGERVTVRAAQRDLRGARWRSTTAFTADRDGTVDLARDAPVEGSYDGVDPMGLIWSMRPLDALSFDGPVDVRHPTELDLTASAPGVPDATATVRRRRIPAGLVRTEVREHGLVGVMYHPAGRSGLGAVLMLAGAEAGIHEDDAALLAAHGYAVLALALAGVPGRPPTLQDIPLEYAHRAIDHLRSLPFVDPGRLVVTGGSKGGEAALLIGATNPAVTGVVSIVGSGVLIAGISQDVMTGSFLEIMRTPVANWTVGGRPLPYVPTVVTAQLEKLVAEGAPVPLRLAFEPGLSSSVVAEATIPVERINGPVLLLSGECDASSGPAFHQFAADRLAAHGRPHEHVVYPGAGHQIAAPPYAPTTVSVLPIAGVTFDYGGEPAATAKARADVWRRTLEFLSASG